MSDSSSSTLEIYSWWQTASEQAALQVVLGQFSKSDPNVSVVNRAAENAPTAQQELQSRMRQGDPPDTFQVNGGADLGQYAAGGTASQLEPLDALAVAQNWQGVMPARVIQSVTFDGHIYAVPVDIARVNALFYNIAKLGQYGLSPPQTMADFESVARSLAANHETAVAIGDAAPWALEVIFKGCLVAAGGASYYTQFVNGLNPFFSGATPGTPNGDPVFGQALGCLSTILAYSNKSVMRTLTWDEAVAAVSRGDAAMTIMGDWAHGEFLQQHGVANVTFGEVPAPGSGDAFIFTTDTFVLPIGAKNRAAALTLLADWGSSQGQSAFYPLKGSLPSRSDVDPAGYDAISRQTLADFADKTVIPDWALAVSQDFSTAFDLALDRFADDGNAENVMLAAWNYYDSIVPQR